MSSTIGKDQPPGHNPNVTRQQQEQAASAVERDERATRFRESLGKPDQAAAERAAGNKAREASLASTRSGNTKASAKPEGGDKTARGEKEPREGGPDKSLPLGLTGEQALALEAALSGVGGAGERKPRGMTEMMSPDDMGLGGVDRKLGKTPGEEALVEVAAAVSAAAAPLQGQSWTRPEGPQQRESRARELPQPLPGVDPIHQLFIGRGPGGAEARMMITVGPLAGTEIQLREGPGGVQASIITTNASARQTLTSAMAAVAERLKAKGQKLDVRFDGQAQEQGAFGRFAQQRQEK